MVKFSKKEDGLYELDCKGYVCPHPQLYTLKSMEKLNSGDILEVIFDNPSSLESITSAVNRKGYKILGNTQPQPGVFDLKIQKP